MGIKLEQLVVVMIRCLMLCLMLAIGFRYISVMGGSMYADIIKGNYQSSVFFLVGTLLALSVLLLIVYKSAAIASRIVPKKEETAASLFISASQIEVIFLRVLGVWMAAEAAILLVNAVVTLGYDRYVPASQYFQFALRVCVGIAIAVKAQELSKTLRRSGDGE